VVFKGLIAAAAAVALSATPALAQANNSGPLGQAVGAEVAPAGETVEGESEMFGRGGFIIPLIVIIVIALGIYVAIDDEEDDLPASP